MSEMNRRTPWVTPIPIVILVGLLVLLACVSTQRHIAFVEGTKLTPVDKTTGQDVSRAHVFLYTTLEARGWVPVAEARSRKGYYEHLGPVDTPVAVPERKYRTFSYNFYLWGRRPASCYSAVVLYKRGYLTTLWTPRRASKVEMLKTSDSNMSDRGTGEGEIDWLLQWSCLGDPDRSRFYSTEAYALLPEMRAVSRYVQTKKDFRDIIQFCIKEYQHLLGQPSLDQPAQTRLNEKVKLLSEFLEDY